MADTPALDALLRDVEDLAHREYPITGPYIAAAPRLAAIVRVLVEELRNIKRGAGPWPKAEPYSAQYARTALARAEAIARGES